MLLLTVLFSWHLSEAPEIFLGGPRAKRRRVTFCTSVADHKFSGLNSFFLSPLFPSLRESASQKLLLRIMSVVTATNRSAQQNADVHRKLHLLRNAIEQLEADIQSTRCRHSRKQEELKTLLLRNLQQHHEQSTSCRTPSSELTLTTAAALNASSVSARKSVTFSRDPLDIRALDDTGHNASASSRCSSISKKLHNQNECPTVAKEQLHNAPSPSTIVDDLHTNNTTPLTGATKKRSRTDYALIIDGPVEDAQRRSQSIPAASVLENTVKNLPHRTSAGSCAPEDSFPPPSGASQQLLPRRRLQLTFDDSSPICLSPPTTRNDEINIRSHHATIRRSNNISPTAVRSDFAIKVNSAQTQLVSIHEVQPKVGTIEKQTAPLTARNVNAVAQPAKKKRTDTLRIVKGHDDVVASPVAHAPRKVEWPESFSDNVCNDSDNTPGSQLLSAMVAARRALARSSIVLAGGETEYLDL